MSDDPNKLELEPEHEETLASRLGSSGTLLVLFYDHWFALISLVILLFGIFLGLFLPRIWQQTPDGFTPVVKVSGLDMWQARSLRRSANKNHAAGRFNEAIIAWNSAIANNSGDPEVIREALAAILAQPVPPPDQMGFGVSRAFWLLRLTKTNAADLDVTMRLLAAYKLDDYVLSLGGPYRDALSPAAKAILARAYFDQGKTRDFGEFWDRNAAGFSKDADLSLYRSAWMASVGPAAGAAEAQAALARARSEPGRRALAARLQLSVSYTRQDLAGFAEALRVLEDEHADLLAHHVFHWLMLNSAGRGEEARTLARDYARPPATPGEANLAAEGFRRIGLLDHAISYLEQHVPRFPFEPSLWVTQARFLIEAKHWTDLRAVALAMRNEASLQSTLDSYSYFAEAVAESRMDRPDVAAAAADRVPRAPLPGTALAREVARTLRAEGFPKPAVEILRGLREKLPDDAGFWFDYTVAAFSASAEDDILPAAKRAFELAPRDISAMNNYAAALIAFRRQPDEAVKLTLRVVGARPRDNDSQMNHVLALLQNGRDADAEAILRGMNTLSFGPAEQTVYNLCWFELGVRRKDWTQARAAYGRIDPHQLLSVQVRWLDEAFRAIPSGA